MFKSTSAPAAWRGAAVGHGRTRQEAIAEARLLAGLCPEAPLQIISVCEIAGTWTVLARPGQLHA